MILASDSYQRIFRQMSDEREKVQYYIQRNKEKFGKILSRTHTLPICHCEVQTLPRTNNTYLLYYYALTWSEVRSRSCFSGAPLILNDDNGDLLAILYRRMHLHGDGRDERVEALQVYSGHFFGRYRERMKLPSSLSTHDVMATYFGRNGGYFAKLDYDEIVLKKNRHKGNSAWGVDDGVLLSEETYVKDGNFYVFEHNTFLSRSELKPNQADATPSRYAMRKMCLEHFMNTKRK